MSEIQALKKLRKLTICDKGEKYTAYLDAGEIADEVEAEIAERFMELPCDVYGVPIHIGDTLQLGDTCGEVVALTYCPDNGKLPWEWQCDTGDWYKTAFARHVKPRTLEDALCDAFADVSCIGDGIKRHFEPDDPYVAEVADEIRAMFGAVDA